MSHAIEVGRLPGVTIDFSELECVDEEPAQFEVVVEDILLRRGRSGFDYLSWDLSITTGPHRDRRLRFITSLHPLARRDLWITFRSFGVEDIRLTLETEDEVVSWVADGKRFTRVDRHLTSPDLIGRAAIATVENSSYEDRPQTRVVKLLPAR
jgi:hypothetical protein